MPDNDAPWRADAVILDDALLRRARAGDRYPRPEARERLVDRCRRHLRRPPTNMLRLPRTSNLFVWNTTMLELGVGYAVTENERYLNHLRMLTWAFGDGQWRDEVFDGHIHFPFVLAALAVHHDLYRDRLRDDERELVEKAMREMAEHVWHELRTQSWGSVERTVWNHNVVGYSSMGLVALALDDHPDAEEWLATSIDRTRRFLDTGLTPAGMTWEGLSYCGLVFKHLGLLIHALGNVGRRHELVGPEQEARLRNVPRWYAHETFPGGRWMQNYNDSHWDPHAAMWGFLATFGDLEPELCAAVWERLVGERGHGTFGYDRRRSSLAETLLFFPDVEVDLDATATLDDAFFCPDVGYLACRDRWDDGGSVFTFNAGPFIGGIHDQADNNSFTFIARGEPLVIDGGSANDNTEGSASSSLGHNLVFVDGVGQHTAGEGIGVSGRIVAVERGADHVAVVGDATASYNQNGHNPVRHAFRHAVFVQRPVPYVVVYDDIRKDDDEHAYEWVVHVPFAGDLWQDGAVGTVPVLGPDGAAAGALRFLHPATVTHTAAPFRTGSPPYQDHALWRFGTRAVDPHFAVLLAAASDVGDAEPRAAVDLADDAVSVTLTWAYGTDELAFARVAETAGARADPALPRFARRST